MTDLKKKLIKDVITRTVVAILIITICYSISWITICEMLKLIALCFGLTFRWSIATGIWMVICLLWNVSRLFDR